MSWHQPPRLRVARMSLHRLRDRLRDLLRSARDHKMASVIRRINRLLLDHLVIFGRYIHFSVTVPSSLKAIAIKFVSASNSPPCSPAPMMRPTFGEGRAFDSWFYEQKEFPEEYAQARPMQTPDTRLSSIWL